MECRHTLLLLMLFLNFLKQQPLLVFLLDEQNKVLLTSPCGIEDVLSLQVKPTPHFLETKERIHMYNKRVNQKKWQSKWPNITITYPEI